MPDVTVKGRKAEIVQSQSRPLCYLISSRSGEPGLLSHKGKWRILPTDDVFWPTRESAEQFLREHADKPTVSGELAFDPTENYALTGEAMRVAASAAREHEEALWDAAHLIAHGKDSRAGDGRTLVTATHVMDAIAHKAAPDAETYRDEWSRPVGEQFADKPADPPAVTISTPLADLIFRKCGLTQEQAVRVAEVLLGEGEWSWPKSKIDAVAEATRVYSLHLKEKDAELTALREQLAEARRERSDELARDHSLQQLAVMWDETTERKITALRSQLAGVQGALMDAGDVLAIRTDGDYGASVREVVEQRDAAREQVKRLEAERDRLWRIAVCPPERVSELETEVEALGTATPEACRAIDAFNHRLDKLRLTEKVAECRRQVRTAQDAAVIAIQENADLREQLTARDEELRRLRSALNDLAIQPEYDCPGDTPEICGYLCLICHGRGSIEGDVEHKPDCDLASPPPPRTITGDGKPLPPGVWAGHVSRGMYACISFEDAPLFSVVGHRYTFVGPVPEEGK